MRGQVTIPVIITAFILLIVISPLIPVIYTSLSTAIPYMDPATKLIAYVIPFFFLLGPALMVLGYYNITNILRGERGGEQW